MPKERLPVVPSRLQQPQESDVALSKTRPPSVAVLLMSRLRWRHTPWALERLARGPSAWPVVRGLRFAQVLGSGWGGGFGLWPGLNYQGIFAAFDAEDAAHEFATASEVAQAYRHRSLEHFGAVLACTSSRGSWSGHTMAQHTDSTSQAQPDAADDHPIAALTRASIRPRRAVQFWRHAPATHQALAQAAGCRVAVGLGEAPLLRQATFSVWDSAQKMHAYARRGAHQTAIEAAWGDGLFSESLFVRFRPLWLAGNWAGMSVTRGDVPDASAKRGPSPGIQDLLQGLPHG